MGVQQGTKPDGGPNASWPDHQHTTNIRRPVQGKDPVEVPIPLFSRKRASDLKPLHELVLICFVELAC